MPLICRSLLQFDTKLWLTEEERHFPEHCAKFNILQYVPTEVHPIKENVRFLKCKLRSVPRSSTPSWNNIRLCNQPMTCGQNRPRGTLMALQIAALHHIPPVCQSCLDKGNEYRGRKIWQHGRQGDWEDVLSVFVFAKGNTITAQGAAAVGF